MTKLNAIDRAAARLADTREGSRFDERERAVYNESATFANTLGTLVALVLSVALASIGHFVASFVVLFAMVVPDAGAAWYSMRRGVDPMKLRDSRRDKIIVWSAIVLVALLFVAWGAPIFADRPLFEAGIAADTQPTDSAFVVWAIVLSCRALTLWTHLQRRRIRRAERSDQDE
ncbi:hypothetical protein [Nesterenkonia sp. NBAIMH1]|uniref:hypothetical protein n=1 Tax=Nesterenkonia sp. NBAIMH1 TaxID=2600320 RepID=UPI0011B66173|nr:hypothetical protein [Nesterenkonia sp. NBAIMH1]